MCAACCNTESMEALVFNNAQLNPHVSPSSTKLVLQRSNCEGSSSPVSLPAACCCYIMPSSCCVAGGKVCSGWVYASKRLSAVTYGVRVRHQLHRVHLPVAPGLRLCPPAKRAWLSSAGQLHEALVMCLPDCCLLIHDSLGSNYAGLSQSAAIAHNLFVLFLSFFLSCFVWSFLFFLCCPGCKHACACICVSQQVKCGWQAWSYSAHFAYFASLTLHCDPPNLVVTRTAMSEKCCFGREGCISSEMPMAFTTCMEEDNQQH